MHFVTSGVTSLLEFFPNKTTNKTINGTLFMTHAYNVFIMQ